MLYSIYGQVDKIIGQTLVLKVDSISLEINIIDSSLYKVKEKYNLYILDYIKDENLYLFGFNSDIERTLFRQLISLNGIGPQSARTILKNIDCNRLISYIQEGKIKELEKVSGIGNKANRLVNDLKNRLGEILVTNVRYQDAYDVLLSMGYEPQIANKTVNELSEGLETGQAIMEAIRKIKNGD